MRRDPGCHALADLVAVARLRHREDLDQADLTLHRGLFDSSANPSGSTDFPTPVVKIRFVVDGAARASHCARFPTRDDRRWRRAPFAPFAAVDGASVLDESGCIRTAGGTPFGKETKISDSRKGEPLVGDQTWTPGGE